MIEENSLYGLA